MMKRNGKPYLPAFTIMEITISSVVTSIVITLVYSSIAFLNSQLKKDIEIRNQLNTWSVERFQLMHDFFLANEIVLSESNEILLKSDNAHVIVYRTEDEQLWRVNKEQKMPFRTHIKSIELPEIESTQPENIVFIFEIKEETFTLQFPLNQSSAQKMNDWFTQKLNDGTN
jgi:hypothetical protein